MKIKHATWFLLVLPLLAAFILLPGQGLQARAAQTLTPRAYLAVVYNNWPLVQPNDPYYATNQWHLSKVNAPGAWTLTTGSGVTVAVVDTGVDLSHPDLAGKTVAGWDFVNNDGNPQDDNGHGTHVAGIIGASTNNSLGVAGIGWNAAVMPVKVLDATGSGTTSSVAAGITWAVDHGAQVINLSLSGVNASTTLQTATDYAWSHNRLIVAAAGNCADPNTASNNGCSTVNPVMYPAANPNVLAVGATDENDVRAPFSEYNPYIDLTAPGYTTTCTLGYRCGLYSTFWSGGTHTYQWEAGTSMAAPVVAGAAALVWARNPGLTNLQVVNTLESAAVDLGTPGRDNYYGYGRLDAGAAVKAALAPAAASAAAAEVAPAIRPAAPNPHAPRRPGVVLVRLRQAASGAEQAAVLSRHNLQAAAGIQALGVVEVKVPAGREDQVAAELLADTGVEFAEPDYIWSVGH